MLLAISTSLTVLVLNVHHRGSLGNPVPQLVQLVVLDWLSRMLGLGKRVPDKHNIQPNTTKKVRVESNKRCHEIQQCAIIGSISLE